MGIFISKREESTHYDNHIVGNITVVINQWKHLIIDSGNYMNDIIIWIDRINDKLDMWKQTNIKNAFEYQIIQICKYVWIDSE